jgi:hypothetical protein
LLFILQRKTGRSRSEIFTVLVVVSFINTAKELGMIYLYVKRHSKTKLKYFGKTTRDPYKYLGSGLYWCNHINAHGKDFIETLQVWEFDSQDDCTAFALSYSKENNIIESDEWANLKDEDGLAGWGIGNKHNKGRKLTEETKTKISESHKGLRYLKGRKQSDQHIDKRTMSRLKAGYKHSNSTKHKIQKARGEGITVEFSDGTMKTFISKSEFGSYLNVTRTTALNLIKGTTPLSRYNIVGITPTTAVVDASYNSLNGIFP